MTAILKLPQTPDDPSIAALAQQLAAYPDKRDLLLRHLLGEQACRQLGIYPIPEGFKV